MSKILFILPDEELLQYARETLTTVFPDVEVVTAIAGEGAAIVRKHLRRGLEVVAARTVTAAAIRQAGLDVAVVEIPRTSFDILRAIDKANLKGKRLAFISYSEKIWGIELFSEALGVTIQQYTVSYKTDYEAEILAACAAGAEVILGGFTVVKTAERHNIPNALIRVGKESLLQAASEAKHIQETLEFEAAKRDIFNTILDYSYEGIITIDQNYQITTFNPLAQKYTGIDKAAAIGRPVSAILPQLNLEKVVETGADDLHSIIEVGKVKIMCNKVPIIVNKKPYGAVATLQETGKIQEMEAKIRRQIYARGHIAKFYFKDIIGQSPVIVKAIEIARDFAATDYSLLVLGETGTGKEVFAQSIHNASKRAQGPFVAINCAALPAQLLESELFGYVGGAFTGANKEGKPGLFEVAHGGTILLDEIAEMDYVNQGRLLRVLQEKTVVRLGSHKVIPIDVRVIAATNKDLELLIRENKFRDDLYYRLNVLNLELPPLRSRKPDIRLYAEAFCRETAVHSGVTPKFSSDALRILERHSWPGNIRELKNIVERTIATAKTVTITSDLLQKIFPQQKTAPLGFSPKEQRMISEIRETLKTARGNYTAAARLLGVNRSTLWRRIKKYRIEG
ncbi:sigma 54-interacting transcriptional regulator|uniref:PAS domain S-box-containing protein n=1 Tax=Dendrosporobacter quercicolus TaxID=146817 RepID=A0A1G9VDM4_9FIRM|nr:sigma 54-interacting transcriptional regulator [Dendrosporobacter quercicolus]NSL47843.1 sigma 54-interacting transcriptional regulator [Dendrosporobacter quercicolus DSM 1736]SDM70173.1 PAS domain S-box-containing protein [Dendrosporobacter quercicolus]